MATYKPGLEYSGLRGALARVREFLYRHKLYTPTLITVPLVCVVVFLLFNSGTENRIEYCAVCGSTRTATRTIVGGLCTAAEQRVDPDGYLTHWVEADRGLCLKHDWRTGYAEWRGWTSDKFIWRAGIPTWGDVRDALQDELSERQFLRLATLDESRARKLVGILLGPPGGSGSLTHWLLSIAWLTTDDGDHEEPTDPFVKKFADDLFLSLFDSLTGP